MMQLPCHAYLSLLITNPNVTIISENTLNWSLLGFEHVSQSPAGACALLLFTWCQRNTLPVTKAIEQFCVDLSMTVSNSLTTVIILNEVFQRR